MRQPFLFLHVAYSKKMKQKYNRQVEHDDYIIEPVFF